MLYLQIKFLGGYNCPGVVARCCTCAAMTAQSYIISKMLGFWFLEICGVCLAEAGKAKMPGLLKTNETSTVQKKL